MKFLQFLFLLCIASGAFAEDSSPARHYEGIIRQIIPGDGALVKITDFYDFAPGEVIALVDHAASRASNSGSIYVPPIQKKWNGDGRIVFVRGLGKGLADGDEWKGMIEPDGTKTYSTVLNAPKTVHAYKLSSAPDPVENYWVRARANSRE